MRMPAMQGVRVFKSLALVAGLFAFHTIYAAPTATTPVVDDDCAPPAKFSVVSKVDIVYDGGSFLMGNDYVVLTGVHVPSPGRTNQKAEPLGKAAAEIVGELIKKNKGILGLESDALASKKGHVLAHVYLGNGKNLAKELLENGLALVNTDLPNVKHLKCYRDAEAKARANKKGLWQFADKNVPVVPSSALTGDHDGFQIVRGKIVKAEEGSNYFILNMDTLGIRIPNDELDTFNVKDLKALLGKTIEIRGVFQFYKGSMFIRPHHPGQIDVLADKFLPVAKPTKK